MCIGVEGEREKVHRGPYRRFEWGRMPSVLKGGGKGGRIVLRMGASDRGRFTRIQLSHAAVDLRGTGKTSDIGVQICSGLDDCK